jgi:Putative phage abortive infection protein
MLNKYRGLIISSLAITIVWALSGYILYIIYPENTAHGTFGDMFGAVNALFSGLAFAGLFFTIKLQQQQNLVQNFESTFFHLLGLFNDIINNMDYKKAKGRDCFIEFDALVKHLLNSELRASSTSIIHEKIIDDAYIKFNKQTNTELGHYFRTLYNIVKYVHNSHINSKNKQFYINILRAQLSNQELLLLFYNSLSMMGKQKFKPLIEEFALLKNMPKDDIDHDILSLYKFGAYGG